jgi:hypothetical protein
MTYSVLVRIDPAGECPVLVRDTDDALPGGDGGRYRAVGETGDYDQAARWVEAEHARIVAAQRSAAR